MKNDDSTPCDLHLRQPRLVNNPGKIKSFVDSELLIFQANRILLEWVAVVKWKVDSNRWKVMKELLVFSLSSRKSARD
jgi:hypothetical protein